MLTGCLVVTWLVPLESAAILVHIQCYTMQQCSMFGRGKGHVGVLTRVCALRAGGTCGHPSQGKFGGRRTRRTRKRKVLRAKTLPWTSGGRPHRMGRSTMACLRTVKVLVVSESADV